MDPADTNWRPRWWTADPDRTESFCQVGPDTFIHVWRYRMWRWREWAWSVHHLMPEHDMAGHQCYSTQTGSAKGRRHALREAMRAIEITEQGRHATRQ